MEICLNCIIVYPFRFFAATEGNSADLTPTDPESEEMKRCARRLEDVAGETRTPTSSPSSPPHTPSQSLSCQPKRQLFEGSAASKLARFAFANSKRRKSEQATRFNPFSMVSLDQQSVLTPTDDVKKLDLNSKASVGTCSLDSQTVDGSKPTDDIIVDTSGSNCDLVSTDDSSLVSDSRAKEFSRSSSWETGLALSGETSAMSYEACSDEPVDDIDCTSQSQAVADEPSSRTEQEPSPPSPARNRSLCFGNSGNSLPNPVSPFL